MTHKEQADRRNAIKKYRAEGHTLRETAETFGISTGYCNIVCHEYLEYQADKKSLRNTEMRAYKAQGHTMAEVADKFGISKATAQKVCKGIAKQIARPQEYKNQYTNGEFNREANAIKYIEERTPWFEYAGEFTGLDGYVNLKCKKCGTIIRKSFVTVKHGCAECAECKKAETRRKAEKRKKEQEAEAEYRKWFRLSNLKAEQLSMQTCDECGRLFVPQRKGTKYCSYRCANRLKNTKKSDKRREKLQAVYDEDISLEETYKRDKGVCWICGCKCDWDDYVVDEEGNYIIGNRYPTRDHVIPLAKGGRHNWSNIRLACRLCNSKKSDSLIPLCPKEA